MKVYEMQRGLVFTLVGPGGSGKNTLMQKVLQDTNNLQKLATATTRPIRDGEKEGYDHLFVTHERFREMITNNELLEHQMVTDNQYYGILRHSVENKIDEGVDIIADIDVFGAKVLKQNYPDEVILIFVDVPGQNDVEKLETLRQRMENRGEKSEIIAQRIARAQQIEYPFRKYCDYLIINDDVERASSELGRIITETRNKRLK